MAEKNTRVVFEELSISHVRDGRCSACGKRTRRIAKVWQTLNPLNKNAVGVPKSRGEIYQELRVDLDVLLSRPLLCTGCESGVRGSW